MLVLFETPAGYAVFKVSLYSEALSLSLTTTPCPLSTLQLLDEKKLQKVDDLYKEFETPEKASKV